MDRRLTERQRATLDYIVGYVRKNDMSPSLAEIGQAMGRISATAALAHVVALERKGYVKRNRHESRGIEVVGQPTRPEDRPDVYRLPIFGTIAAGQPIEAIEEHAESIWVESSL